MFAPVCSPKKRCVERFRCTAWSGNQLPIRISVGNSISVVQRSSPFEGSRITVICSVLGSNRPIWLDATIVNQTMSLRSTRIVCG